VPIALARARVPSPGRRWPGNRRIENGGSAQEGDGGSVHDDSTSGIRCDVRCFWSDHDDRRNPLL